MSRASLLLLLAAAAAAQKPGAVDGTVTNSATGAPIRKALVTLRNRSQNAGYQVLTDAAGHFALDNVSSGTYGLWAEAQGYVHDVTRFFAPSQRLKIAEGAAITGYGIQLDPLGAVSGRVLDENGDPVAGATVEALRYTYSAVGPHLGYGVLATTNSRGEYRCFDLTPGHIYLRAMRNTLLSGATGRVHTALADLRYGTTYYPGVTREEEAAAVEVAPGAEVPQIDLRLRKSPVFHLRGNVVDGRSGLPAASARVEISDVGYVETRADGSFDAGAMSPGSHRVMAQWKLDSLLVSGVQDIVITDRDKDGIALRLDPAASLQGAAIAEGQAADKLPGARITLQPIGGFGSEARAEIAPDGSFSFTDLIPQNYRVLVNRRPGLYLKSIRLGNQDASADGVINAVAGAGPIALAFASDAGSIEGTVPPSAPGPADVVVTIAPSGPLADRQDLLRSEYVNSDGTFKIENVAPGDYQVFAWEVADESITEYPGFRALLENKAAKVTVRPGEAPAVTLTLITAAQFDEARRKLR